jgi:hypothetical protein
MWNYSYQFNNVQSKSKFEVPAVLGSLISPLPATVLLRTEKSEFNFGLSLPDSNCKLLSRAETQTLKL